ncbi:MAG: tRNA (adenosine(37)-N6)-dimethylallyltransferase MiaA [Candidatus Nanopelagicales bacterium]
MAIVGPTAVGKSDVALDVAARLGAEVLNADAFQLYRGMDIGTAKMPEQARRGIAHHLIDVLDVTDELSVAAFQQRGRAVLADLAGRGVPAVVVGGSGLYVRALLDDLRFPGSDPDVRALWEARLAEQGPQTLHAVLAERDPQAAAHILASNGRRIVRALEVGEITGAPFVAQFPVTGPPLIDHDSFGLTLPREVLDLRIAARVEHMFDSGLVDEVRALLDLGLREAPTAARALGYPQVMDLLAGRLEDAQARAAIVTATRRYARRQERWFRRDPRITWLDASGPPSSTASLIADRVTAGARTLGP